MYLTKFYGWTITWCWWNVRTSCLIIMWNWPDIFKIWSDNVRWPTVISSPSVHRNFRQGIHFVSVFEFQMTYISKNWIRQRPLHSEAGPKSSLIILRAMRFFICYVMWMKTAVTFKVVPLLPFSAQNAAVTGCLLELLLGQFNKYHLLVSNCQGSNKEGSVFLFLSGLFISSINYVNSYYYYSLSFPLEHRVQTGSFHLLVLSCPLHLLPGHADGLQFSL